MVKVRVTVTIDEELLERIDQVSKATRENRSALIERLLRESVTEEEMMMDPRFRDLFVRAVASPEVVESLAGVLEKVLDERQFEAVAGKLHRMRKIRPKHK